MYCSSCGAKISESAKFCTMCGASQVRPASPVQREGLPQAAVDPSVFGGGINREDGFSPVVPAAGSTAVPQESAHAGFGARLVQVRRTTLAAVPTWVIVLLALVLAAGTAYAAYRVVVDLVLPAFEQEDAEKEEEVEETATSDDEEEEEAEPTEEELALAAYEEIIAEYAEAFSHANEDEIGEWEFEWNQDDDKTLIEDAVVSDYWSYIAECPEYPHVSRVTVGETWLYQENLYYCLVDIDGNGVSELIFSSGNGAASGEIDAAFTYADGQLVMLFDGWSRAYYWLCEDGTIGYMSRGGISRRLYRYLELDNGTLTLLEEISQMVDSEVGSSVASLDYYHSIDGVVVEEGSEPYDADDGDTVLAVVATWIEEAQQTHVERELTEWVQLV